MYKLYTDGSSDYKLGEYSSAFIILDNEDNVVYYDYFKGNKESFIKYNNVSGEVMACLYGMKSCVDLGIPSVVVHYDYIGLEKWFNGSWMARNPLSQVYIQSMRGLMLKCDPNFHKVKGHDGYLYNELCDYLAKHALGKKYKGRNEFKEKAVELLKNPRGVRISKKL